MALKSYQSTNEPQPIAESRLWQAVIVRTIEEWISGPLRLKRQAEEYLFRDNSDFPAVCQSAGMDVGRLRAKLMRLRNQASATQPSPQSTLQSSARSGARSGDQNPVHSLAQAAGRTHSPAL
jgi:hypothetical protein